MVKGEKDGDLNWTRAMGWKEVQTYIRNYNEKLLNRLSDLLNTGDREAVNKDSWHGHLGSW